MRVYIYTNYAEYHMISLSIVFTVHTCIGERYGRQSSNVCSYIILYAISWFLRRFFHLYTLNEFIS